MSGFSFARKMETEDTMVEKLIAPGDKLEMKSTTPVMLPDGTEGVKLYKSTVYDVTDDGKIEIVMPMEQSKLVLLPIEGEYEVCFMTRAGMYRANVVITDRDKIQNTYILITEMTSDLHKFQRREYYRFNCIIEMQVKVLGQAEAEAMEKGLSYLIAEENMVRGVIVDISGGGLRFVSKTHFDEGSTLYLKYTLNIGEKDKEFTMAARVLASNEIPKRKDEYQNRVKFIHLDNITREEIIKYIFNEERKNRKNGKDW